MNNKIERGDIVKIKEPLEFENIDGNTIKTEYGIVMDLFSDNHVCVAPYNSEGKMIFRKCGNYVLPLRTDFNLKGVSLFLKGNKPDGYLIKD